MSGSLESIIELGTSASGCRHIIIVISCIIELSVCCNKCMLLKTCFGC